MRRFPCIKAQPLGRRIDNASMNARATNATLALALLTLGSLRGSAADGTRLPTEWSIASPAGTPLALGTLPTGIAVDPAGTRAAIVEAGAGPPGVRFVALAGLTQERFVPLKATAGRPVWDGDGVWVAGGNSDAVYHVRASDGGVDRTIAVDSGSYPIALARARNGAFAVAGESSGSVMFYDRSGTRLGAVAVGKHPSNLIWSADGKRVFATLWGERAVAVVDAATRTLRTTIAVGYHPEALIASADGQAIFVANADDDSVSVIDARTLEVLQSIDVGFFNQRVYGASPNALALSANGALLYVACSGANAVAVLRVEGSKLSLAGAIPAGWFPTGVAFDGAGQLLVLNGKGEGSKANPQFSPYGSDRRGYIATSLGGSLRRTSPVAGPAFRVVENGGPYLRAAIDSAQVLQNGPDDPAAGRAVVAKNGPIKHVIYIIKENRTYDQVLGDLPAGDGDPRLVLFGAGITPNQHALAQRFGLFDRTFADAQVSADGHNWSTAAYANDYTSKMWPPLYGGRRRFYDFEDGADASVPHSGYLWDEAAHAGITYRDYGEFVTTASRGAASTTEMPGLKGHIDPKYPGFNLAISDRTRIDEWLREFRGYERSGNLPALEIVRLPNDHTAGTRAGALTPQAFVAQNDYAFGRLLEAVSHSRYWKETAIFAIEDDAQNGADHVDEQRTTFYLASPYARPGVHHEHYSTAGVLRTIELILGFAPLSAYDASARPLYDAFTPRANAQPFDAVRPADMTSLNKVAAYGSAISAAMDLDHADRVDPQTMNDVLWGAIKGRPPSPPAAGRLLRRF